MLHSANWDDSIQLEGKRVGVIGSGSSAVQIVPNIQPLVSSLKCFIRSQSWVTASFGQRFAGKGGTNFKCKPDSVSLIPKGFPTDWKIRQRKAKGDPTIRPGEIPSIP
jgi:cation diffusion facilitator CzcD-associated flavoprotein CzcO